MRYLLVLLCVLVASSVEAAVVFEDNSTFVTYLKGDASVGIEPGDTYHGSKAIRVTVPASAAQGQVYNANIPGVNFRVVANPVAANEVRWMMFAWKKVSGSDALMVQIANSGNWGPTGSPIVSPPAPVWRYVAGDNLQSWSAVRVAWQSPLAWTVVIRDLYADFGSFQLTGMAFTPFDGVALFDSIYVAKTYNELMDVYQQGANTKLVIESPEGVNENDYFTAKVRIENAYNVSGYAMEVIYNPDILKAYSVAQGSFLSLSGNTFWLDPDIDPGRISEIASVTAPVRGVSGTGTLFEVTFKGKDPGESYIRLEDITLLDSQGQVVPVQSDDITVLVSEFPRWDVNRDGRVDVLDFIAIAKYYGQVATDISRHADVNSDGKIDVQDLVLVGKRYGDVYWSGAPAIATLPAGARDRLADVLMYLTRDGGDEDSIRLVQSLLEKLPRSKVTTWGRVKREQ